MNYTRPEPDFTFFVHGPLPGLNEIIKAAKASPFAYSTMKKKWTAIVVGQIIMANHTHKRNHANLPVFDKVIIDCEWIEAHNRRDPDNVFSACKFLLDGMEKSGIIPRDSRKHIKGIIHSFGDNDKQSPGVRVTVKEY